MKITLNACVIAAVFSFSTVSYAQSSLEPVTGAQVKAELVQLEEAGYRPEGKQLDYPAGIQAAEAKIHAQQPGDSSYGGISASGSSAAGVYANPFQRRATYGHH